jgi:hypothetical protein
MTIAAHDPRRWGASDTWTDEQYEDAIARTPPFGQRFFSILFREQFHLRLCVRFMRWSTQPDDVYAVFDIPGGGAGVQIDSDLEYVIVWGADGVSREFGDWGEDHVPLAIAHMRQASSADRQEAEPGATEGGA